MNVRFLPAGDAAVVVEFGDRIDRDVSEAVLALTARVRASDTLGLVETVPTYRSLLVHFDPLLTSGSSIVAAIQKLLGSRGGARKNVKVWRIPACYDASRAPDLLEVAQRTGCTADEVVRLHTGTVFHVYMIGFVPGYPYMGDLPGKLHLPRRTDPRVKVPAGSIAIAAAMTAIYPVESPGGWHLIGATPIRLFDVRAPQPALLAPGDRVRFDPVGTAEFDAIRAAVEADDYRVPFETMEP